MIARPEPAPAPVTTQRLDKWLWFARVVKTRTLAAALVLDGRVRVNRARAEKPSVMVRPGDVITVAVHSRVRILKVTAPGSKRESATFARSLFEELTPSPESTEDGSGGPERLSETARREPGAGRPTKRDRRALDRLRRGSGD
jgi:ribosome-associated heat shock protein Hsp15